MADELIDVVDESNNLTGEQKMKWDVHREGLWHRASYIWVYNSHGEVMIQLRTKRVNDSFSGKWDVSAAGHIGAGEDPTEGALREVAEEIGLVVKKEDLEFSKIRKQEIILPDKIIREFHYIYYVKFDGDTSSLNKQDAEVQELKFIPADELEKDLAENPDRYVPHSDGQDDGWVEAIEEIKNRTK